MGAKVKWTYEKCKEEISKYNNRNELKSKNKSLHNIIYENGWLELLENLEPLKLKNGYWSYENCKKHTLECESKSEFCKKYPGGYSVIRKNKWYELYSHMKVFGNLKKRLVYVYEFSDKSCYVGLTYDITRRHKQHMFGLNSSVYEHMSITNLIPKLVLKSEYIKDSDAVLLEEYTLNEYKDNGWYILNKVKTGSLGSVIIKWNKEACIEEIKKYDRLLDFQLNSGSAYIACNRNGWRYLLDKLDKRTPRGYFNNKELCRKEALKYKNRSELLKNCWSAYKYSKINGWLDEFFK
jgi:predicted GIY-YIG superfamily endonuclease